MTTKKPFGPDDRLIIDPQLGDVVVAALERMTGVDCHIILIALPVVDEDGDGFTLGQPSFVTSLLPDEMKVMFATLADLVAGAGEPTIQGTYP
jgi:hypothetical protein